MSGKTFLVDCPRCKAKVAAEISGIAEDTGRDYDGDPYGDRVYVGKCPMCNTLIAGESHQIEFEGIDSEFDIWSDVVRLYPEPLKTFSSSRIPNVVKDSLLEGYRSLRAGAPTAACVMFGRALEGVCRDMLRPAAERIQRRRERQASTVPSSGVSKIMLAEGIRKLKEQDIIDQRLYAWSQELHAFRNMAAHPDSATISQHDAEDLEVFVYAIVEYIYDLSERYEEFKKRLGQPKAA